MGKHVSVQLFQNGLLTLQYVCAGAPSHSVMAPCGAPMGSAASSYCRTGLHLVQTDSLRLMLRHNRRNSQGEEGRGAVLPAWLPTQPCEGAYKHPSCLFWAWLLLWVLSGAAPTGRSGRAASCMACKNRSSQGEDLRTFHANETSALSGPGIN